MKIRFKVEGGLAAIPRLSEPKVIDTDEMSPDEAAQLNELIAHASASVKPAPAPPRGAADYQTYKIDVEQDNGGSESIETSDLVEDPKIQALVQKLQNHVRKAESTS